MVDATEASPLLNNHNHVSFQVEATINSDNGNSDTTLTAEPPSSPPQQHLRRERSRSMSEVIVDVIAEGIHDVKDVLTEGYTEVKEVIAEVLEEQVLPVRPRDQGEHDRKLSALALSILVFYKVSGGPFGCEPTVKAAGPFYALLGFTLFPFIWCIQEVLVTAELGSAYPEPSGSVAWVEEAFGPKAGLVCGYFHWVSGATDNAIYPSLFLQYVISYLQQQQQHNYNTTSSDAEFSDYSSILNSDSIRFAFSVAIACGLAFINYTGLEIVGNVSIVVCIISMSPFVLLFIMGLPHVQPERWMVLPVPMDGTNNSNNNEDDVLTGDASWFFPMLTMGGVLWRPFVNNLFWNLNSFDVGASFAGEVQDPERVFPRAMFLSVVFVVSSYVLPLLVALGVSDTPQQAWEAGHLTVVAGQIGGPWLAGWLVLASAVSNIALFEAEMSGDAYQLMGMADRGLIPKIFCKRSSRFGTPTNGILVGLFVIICLSVANFDQLVEMLNFAYAVSLLMEFAAFIKLRITDPDVPRPYRIPFGTLGCIIFLSPACGVCLFLMTVGSKLTYVYFLGLCGFGVLFHILQKTAKHYGWWAYVEAVKKKKTSNSPLAKITGLQ